MLKEESKKLVSCLHRNLMNQNEAFLNEKNQLNEYIDKLSLDFEELLKNNDINVQIPSIKIKIKNKKKLFFLIILIRIRPGTYF